MEPTENDLLVVKKRAVRGVAILASRGVMINAISQFAWIFLLAYLSPSQMGVFFIVNAVVSFLVYFSDIGLAAALIQKKEKLTEIDLRTTFTVQQGLILMLITIIFLGSPFISKHYGLNKDGVYLLYALGISLFLSSLKSIPSILLERKLEFGKFVMPEILENLSYNLILVFLAWKGMGITSFTYAVLARGVVGLVAIYWLQPWVPGIAFSKKTFRELMKFGVPYQLNTLVSVFKDQGITLILGGMIGTAGVGIIGTAMRISQIPLRLVMDNVTKVSFPAFSRMQDEPNELAKTMTVSIKFITFLVFPMIFGLMIMAPILVVVVPRYSDWSPALVPLTIVSINTLFAAVATQMSNFFTATGRIKLTIKITLMYTVLTIILVPGLAKLYGVNGAAIGYTLVGVASIIPIIIARRLISFSLIEAVFKPLLGASLMAIIVYILSITLDRTFTNAVVEISVGGGSYLLISMLMMGQSLRDDAKKIIYSLKKQ